MTHKIERHVDLFLGQLVITTANFTTLTLIVTCGGEVKREQTCINEAHLRACLKDELEAQEEYRNL